MKQLANEPVSVLLSYHYLRTDSEVDRVAEAVAYANGKGVDVRILIDSGAFSAYHQGADVTVEGYGRWLARARDRWGDAIVGAISLDVLYDPVASWGNWEELGCDLVPVVHLDAPVAVLARYVDAGARWVAFGGMVGRRGLHKTRWSAHLFRWLRDHAPQVAVHGLGVSSPAMVEALPWWSVDASSFAAGIRYGQVRVFDPALGQFHTVRVDGGPETHRYGKLLRNVYGIDPGDIRSSSAENRREHLTLAALTAVAWQQYRRNRHPIPSESGPDGTWVHFVETSSIDLAVTLESVADRLTGGSR
jgi:hypothetical protein